MSQADPCPQLMLIAGETSGDRYAAELIEELRRRHPDWTYCGMGSEASRKAGLECLVDSSDMAVVGLVEVLRHYPQIRSAFRLLRNRLRQSPPDLLILIDYPEFNLKLARVARKLGIPTLFYVSPQLWAWRAWRVRQIRRRINHMAVILPFEQAFYEKHQIPVTYTGHPLSGRVLAQQDASLVRARWGLSDERPIIGLYPGSRRSELTRLLPVCVEAVRELQHHPSQPQFVLAMAPGLSREDYTAHLPSDSPILCVREETYDLMQVCTMALAASGTITLQLALMQIPFCMIYRMAAPSYAIARLLVRIDRYCLPNIITQQDLVEELIQSRANGEEVAAVLRPWLEDPERLQEVSKRLGVVQEKLGPAVGMNRLADCVENLLQSSPSPAAQGQKPE